MNKNTSKKEIQKAKFNKGFNWSFDFKCALVLFFLAFLQYSNTLKHGYVLDDAIVIKENKTVQEGIKGIPKLFVKSNSQYVADKYGYRPIVLTSFAVEYQIFGLNPSAGHFMNVLYFAILVVVLFQVLRKVFFNYSAFAPLLIAIFFTVHPIHVEVVANIKSRDEIFALLFSLLSLKYLIRYNERSQLKYLLFSLLAFAFAFLSKESAFTFLIIMPLTLFYMQNWHFSKVLLKIAALSVILLLVSLLVVKWYMSSTAGVEVSTDKGTYVGHYFIGNSFINTFYFSDKIANALTLLALYLKNFLLPVNLVYYYGYNQIPLASWSDGLVIFSLLLHILLLGIAVTCYKKYPAITYGLFFYFITISFYTHIVMPLADTMADRFLFTPSIGLCIFVVFGSCRLLNIQLKNNSSLNKDKLVETIFDKKLFYVFLIPALLLSLKTFSRNIAWKNSYTLFSTDMQALENCSRAHFYYANALRNKLKETGDLSLESEIIKHYKRSIEITDSANFAYLGLASLYTEKGNYIDAIKLLKPQAKLYALNSDVHYYLGKALIKNNNVTDGIVELKTSLELAAEYPLTYYELALAYSKNGNYDLAINTLNTMQNKFKASAVNCDGFGKVYFEKVEAYVKNRKANLSEIANQKQSLSLTKDEQTDLQLSTNYMLKSISLGANPEMAYGTIIGRYQVLNLNDEANNYYKMATENGVVFQRH